MKNAFNNSPQPLLRTLTSALCRSCGFESPERWVAILACCALSLSGCGSSADSHEEEHLEHFVPVHKPGDFGDLVEQLAMRAPRLAEGGQPSGGSDEDRVTALLELSDIISWIPELAADSELMKADFESAVATGNKLRDAFAQNPGSQKKNTVDAATFEPLIDELRKLIPQSQDRKEQMSSWPK
jgi:hypothetical protein